MRTKVKVMIAFIAVIAVSFIGYNVYKAQSTKLLSDIAMANVEALATPEGDDWVKENLDTTCAYCINMVGGHGVFSTVSMVLVVVITQFVLPDIVGDYSIIGDKIKKIKTSYCRFL